MLGTCVGRTHAGDFISGIHLIFCQGFNRENGGAKRERKKAEKVMQSIMAWQPFYIMHQCMHIAWTNFFIVAVSNNSQSRQSTGAEYLWLFTLRLTGPEWSPYKIGAMSSKYLTSLCEMFG